MRSTGAIPLKVRHGGVLVERIIGPPVEWDFFSVVRELQAGGGPAFELHTVIAPTDIQVRQIQAFGMALVLQARSIETDSNLLRVELTWNGQWADDTDQMANNLVIQIRICCRSGATAQNDGVAAPLAMYLRQCGA
jgi:hypothetical protein